MSLAEIFGANLRNQRKARELEQSDLAELIGMSTETVSKVERGVAAPSFSTVEKLAAALEVPEAVFFGLGLEALPQSERGQLLRKVNVTLSRMNEDQLARAAKMLAALVD